MDFHIICGVSAPIIIAYHASFKFNNIAGVAFWIMLAVAISGIAGRYLYAQIPQSLNAAKTSYQELQANEEELAEALKGAIAFFRREDRAHLCHARGGEDSPELDAGRRSGQMILLDIRRPFQIAAMRRQASTVVQFMLSMGGLFSTGNPKIEKIVQLVPEKRRSRSVSSFSIARNACFTSGT